MPTVYRVDLRPLQPFSRPVTPRDLHRLACYLLEHPGRDAHGDQPKQFSIWPLQIDRSSELDFDDEDDALVGSLPGRVTIRLCQLDEDPTRRQQLQHRLDDRPNLGLDHPLETIGLEIDEYPMADLAGQPPIRGIEIDFISPTHFSRNGRRHCLPDPVLVWNRIAARWNLTVGDDSPLSIDEDDRRAIASSISLNDCDIEIVGRRQRPDGFIGTAAFDLDRSSDRHHQQIFAAAWALAELSGVGALTTQGHGAIRILDTD